MLPSKREKWEKVINKGESNAGIDFAFFDFTNIKQYQVKYLLKFTKHFSRDQKWNADCYTAVTNKWVVKKNPILEKMGFENYFRREIMQLLC
jgi:hypothetical protein